MAAVNSAVPPRIQFLRQEMQPKEMQPKENRNYLRMISVKHSSLHVIMPRCACSSSGGHLRKGFKWREYRIIAGADASHRSYTT